MDKAEFEKLCQDKNFQEAFAKEPLQALEDHGVDISELPAEVLDQTNAAGILKTVGEMFGGPGGGIPGGHYLFD